MGDEQLRDAACHPGRPQLRDYKVVGGLDTFANRSFWPNFFSQIVARLQWNPTAIDLTAGRPRMAGAPGRAPRAA